MVRFKLLALALTLWACPVLAQEQFGIGTDFPDPQSIMDIVSTDKGILIPRMTTLQRNTSLGALVGADRGMLIYNSSDNEFNYWNGAQWIAFPTAVTLEWVDGGTFLYPADGSNKDVSIGTTITGNGRLNIRSNKDRGIDVVTSTSGATSKLGIYNAISGTGTGIHYGVVNQIGSTAASFQYGVTNNFLSAFGSIGATKFGVSNNFNYNSSGSQYSLFSNFENSGNGIAYGVYNQFRTPGTGFKYGLYNIFGSAATSSGGTLYGSYTRFATGITSANAKYGYYVTIPSSIPGTHYGFYSDATGAGNYAGYFLGNVSIGTTAGNSYILPPSRGTLNQIMQTDGSGNLGWVDPSALSDDDWDRNSGSGYLFPSTVTDNVGIGTNTATYPLTITGNANNRTVNIEHTNSVSGSFSYALRTSVMGTVSPGGGHTNIYNEMNARSQYQRSIHNINNGTSTSVLAKWGVYNELSTAHDIQLVGMYNGLNITANTAMDHAGVDNEIFMSNASAPGDVFGITNSIGTNGTGDVYGFRNEAIGAASGNAYGIYSLFDGVGGSAIEYGVYNRFTSTGSGVKIGTYNDIDHTGTATGYSVYGLAENTTRDYAAWFAGRVAIGTYDVFGTGTPDYYIMPFSRGNADDIIQTDGSGNVSWVDPGTVPDDDWTIGTGTASDQMYPADLNDLVGIGHNDPSSRLDVIDNAVASLAEFRMTNASSSSGNLLNEVLSSGNINMVMLHNRYNNDGGGNLTGVHNNFDGGTVGIGWGNVYGLHNKIVTGPGGIRGVYNEIDYINPAVGSPAPSYGVYTEFASSPLTNGRFYGMYNEIAPSSNDEQYGVYNILSGSGSGEKYGTYNEILGSPTGDVYGTYNRIGGTTASFAYAVYGEAASLANYYAGFFDGNVYIGSTPANGYIMPVSDGANGQMIQTDGAGQASWVTPTGDISGVTAGNGLVGGGTTGNVTINAVATNGLTATSNDIRLGGTLTQATTIDQGIYQMAFNLNGAGDFVVQDAGVNHFEVRNNGLTYFGDDTYWNDGSTAGTTIARLYDSGDDGIFQVYYNGAAQHSISSFGTTVFNEQSLDVDLRVESDDRVYALLVDAGNDVVRFGSAGGALTSDGTTIGGAVVDYMVDIDNGAAFGTATGIGSGEFLFDASTVIMINDGFAPTTHINRDLGVSTTANGWDDVYADNYVNISDGRSKKNIKDLPYGLDEVLEMRPVSYLLKEDPFQEPKLGLIAQEILPLVSESVKTHNYVANDESKPDEFEKVELERMGMMYNQLIPVLIKATQEQQEIINEKNSEIQELKALVGDLVTRMGELEKKLN